MAIRSARAKTISGKSLRDVCFILFRQKKKAMVFFMVVVGIAIIGTILSARIYQSDAQIMVRLGRENVTLDPTATTGQVVNIDQSRENLVRSEMEILKSQALAETVVDAVGYESILKSTGLMDNLREADIFYQNSTPQVRDRAKATQILMRKVQVDSEKNTNTISVSYKSVDPDQAYMVVSKMIESFLDKHISVYRTPGSEEFFAQQVELLRSKLGEAEENLRNLKNTSGISAVREQRSILLNRIGSLQKDLEATEAALGAAQAKVQSMRAALSGLPNSLLRIKLTGYPQNPVDYIQQRLTDLKLKQEDLRSKFHENDTLVVEVRRQVAEFEALLKKQGATNDQMADLTLLSENAAVKELLAKAAMVRKDLAAAKDELGKINETELQITRLTREIEVLAANYRSYTEKMEQARIDRSLETGKISNISIVQPATLPVKPVRPRPFLNLVLGVFLGMVGGIGLAFFFEHVDHTFKKPEDVEDILGFPVLAAMPDSGSARKTRAMLDQTLRERATPIALLNSYESILNHLLHSVEDPADPWAVVAITSYYRGEGVTTVATNLAAALAQLSGRRVLLVDANFARPSIHQIFGVAQSPGLIEVVQKGTVDASSVKTTPFKNLDILPAGQGAPDFSLLFESRALADLMSQFRREYSFVVFDAPALNDTSAGLRMAGFIDGVILVLEAERTRWEAAYGLRQTFEQGRIKLYGVVLNKRRFYIPGWLYRTI